MNDKRRSPRLKIQQAIEICFPSEKYITVKTIDISRHGILFETTEPTNLNSRMFLMLSLEEDPWIPIIKCEGIVIRCGYNGKCYTTAVEFTDFSDSDWQKLEKNLRE